MKNNFCWSNRNDRLQNDWSDMHQLFLSLFIFNAQECYVVFLKFFNIG